MKHYEAAVRFLEMLGATDSQAWEATRMEYTDVVDHTRYSGATTVRIRDLYWESGVNSIELREESVIQMTGEMAIGYNDTQAATPVYSAFLTKGSERKSYERIAEAMFMVANSIACGKDSSNAATPE